MLDVTRRLITMTERVCLIVDDEPAIREYLRALLERERFQCLEAESADQALAMIPTLEGHLDLVVSDITMPGQADGIDLAHSVRKSFPFLPVILISGCGEDRSGGRGTPCFRFLQKPFAPKVMLDVVRDAVAAAAA
jgi:DNA-binding NtrC family response regulator